MAGRTGFSAEKSLRLVQILNASRASIEKRLAKPATVQILNRQEKGQRMTLASDGSGWVSREGDSAADPNNRGDDITDTWKVGG